MNYAPPLRGLALDRDLKSAKAAYRRFLKVEREYATNLRRIARHIADLVGGFDLTQPVSVESLRTALEQYANILGPWAESAAARMIAEVARRDEKSWYEIGAQIGRSLKSEIADAPTGFAMRTLMQQQVSLITSLPREAAERVHALALEGMTVGQRPETLARKILETGEVTKSRATLIARTGTARAASVLSQVRAQSIGCTHFQWKTTGDSDVRPSHRALNGKTFRYDNPPISDPPDKRSLPGQIWNCRCVAFPIIPEV